MSEIDLLIQELRDTIDNQREEIDRLNNIINELENIRKEAIKYIEKEIKDMPLNGCKQRLTNLLNILNKGSDK